MELDLKSKIQNIFLYLESPWNPLSNATRLTQFGDFYKEQCANHWRLRELNWNLDRTQCLSKKDITPSYGIGFGCISTHWKYNFRGYPMDILFEVCSILDNEICHEQWGGSDNGDIYLRKVMITMMKKAWAMLPWDFYDQVQLQEVLKILVHEHTSGGLCTQVMLWSRHD